jgi:hypothetical protein
LLTPLEEALGGSLVEELQAAVQRDGTLDSVARQHLVQTLICRELSPQSAH